MPTERQKRLIARHTCLGEPFYNRDKRDDETLSEFMHRMGREKGWLVFTYTCTMPAKGNFPMMRMDHNSVFMADSWTFRVGAPEHLACVAHVTYAAAPDVQLRCAEGLRRSNLITADQLARAKKEILEKKTLTERGIAAKHFTGGPHGEAQQKEDQGDREDRKGRGDQRLFG